MKPFLFALALLLTTQSFAVGTVSVSRVNLGVPRHGQKVVVSFVADASDGSLPATEIGLGGIVSKVVTNPGSTAPTDNYDIACGDPSDTALDVFGGALANRDTANTEQVYPVVAGATMPVYASTCTLAITGNLVNSATGAIEFYVIIP
jgi:hypothetical protein